MEHKPTFYEKYTKRALDMILSGGALVVLSPVPLVTAVLVRTKLGRPVIFCQPRPGKDGKIFNLYKFRSMTDQRDQEGNLLPDEVRLTKFGKLLRSTSLDELPELWNILRGDMSIVGPRPLLVKYLPLYNEEQRHRHDVLPGLTGWAQVNGRNSITWEDKFRLDLWYVRNISFALDLKILFLTVKKVFCREGISSDTAATMEEFKGTDKETVNV
jgi:lipopolysaccharide/colanic/teichoic acid biosynthesis glycosyltransferase